ncbi:LptF/LptG family permease, partial [Thioclava sp. BHET1]
MAQDPHGGVPADRDADPDRLVGGRRGAQCPSLAGDLSARADRRARLGLPALARAAARKTTDSAGEAQLVKLNFYIIRKYLFAFVSVFAAFGLLLILLDLVEELHRAANSPITFLQAVALAVLNTPSGLYRILPLITILATVILFLGLARTSELVVIRAAGRSALRVLLPVVISAFC